jgi:GABA permease
MRRYLVVAHKTLGGAHLKEKVQELLAEGPCRFFLLVPVTHPKDHAWTDGQNETAAREKLAEGLAAFRAVGVTDVEGDIGDANPVYAVDAVVRDDPDFDELIVSTLPAGLSRWLKVDVPSRLAKQFKFPVTHIVAEDARVT